jgi:hypothetical protein
MNNDTRYHACQDWPAGDNSIKKPLCLAVAESFQAQREEIGLARQSFRVGEKEKFPALLQLLTGRNHSMHPF